MKKLIFVLVVIAALMVVAMPAAAQGPNPYIPVKAWYNRTSQMSATWVGDPFGGNPKLTVAVKYEPDGKGGVATVLQSKAYFDYAGIVAKFGLSPFSPENLLPGGIPSSMSGDGSGPRKAIYIGGAWADASQNSANCSGAPGTVQNPGCRAGNENPYELPACVTTKIAAGSSKWFKFDTWKVDNAGNRLRTQIWLDDELDGATQPSGSAVFGAANRYFVGTSNNDDWQPYVFWGARPQDLNEVSGWTMVIYDPDVLTPNYAFRPPNAWLFTLDVSGTGSLRRSCTAAAYAGQPCVPASKGGPSTNTGNSISGGGSGCFNPIMDEFGVVTGIVCQAIKGFAAPNKFQPSHLLWYEGNWDGWVFARVWNQMVWDGTATVCSFRAGGNTGAGGVLGSWW